MKKFFIVFVYCLLISLSAFQQNGKEPAVQKTDKLLPSTIQNTVINPVQVDSISLRITDSIAKKIEQAKTEEKIERFQRVLLLHAILPFNKKAVESNLFERSNTDNEALFYFLVGLLFYFACVRLFFGKYVDNLITLFFRVTMRQQQIREQLLQTPLPSLLLNILFVVCCGFYLSLLARYYQFNFFGTFWITFLSGTAFVTGIYLGKYVVLKITGWIFNISSATDTYIFIVFLVNKMIGIFLLPLILLMSFSNNYLLPVFIGLSYLMLILLLSYRFINSFRPIRSEIKVNRFHFFLYLCAFEIAPLLLIYKVLLAFVERSN